MTPKAVLSLLIFLAVYPCNKAKSIDCAPPDVYLSKVICKGQSFTLGPYTWSTTGIYQVSIFEAGILTDYQVNLTVLEPQASWTGETRLSCQQNEVTLQATGDEGPGSMSYKWEKQTDIYAVDNIAYSSAVSIDEPGRYYLQVTQQHNGIYCASRSWAIDVEVDTTIMHLQRTIREGETIYVQGQPITTPGTYSWTTQQSVTCIEQFHVVVTLAQPEVPTATCRTSRTVDLNDQCWIQVVPADIVLTGEDQVHEIVVLDDYPLNQGYIEGPGTFWAEARATDASVLCRTEITARDTFPPILEGKTYTVVLDETGAATLNPYLLVKQAYDDCGTISLTATPQEVSIDDLGMITVWLTAQDNAGNIQQAVTSVQVDPPVCASDMRWTNTLPSGTYRSEGIIMASAPLANQASVTMTGEMIILEPGFQAVSGTLFSAIAEPCINTTNYAVSNPNVIPSGKQTTSATRTRTVLEDAYQLAIFPNPVRNVLHLSIQGDASKSSRVQLFNIQGRLLYEEDMRYPMYKSHLEHSVDTSVFPTGLYLMRVQMGHLIRQKMIVITN